MDAEVVFNSPSTIDAHRSSIIILKCRVHGNPVDEVQWLKNDKPVSSIGPLVIRHPTQSDNGHYKCMARNRFGTVVSEPYRIEIHPNAHNAIHYGVFCEPKITNSKETSLLCRFKRSGRLHRKRSASEGESQLSQTTKRKKMHVAEDKSATINCDVKGLLRKGNHLSVQWKKDGKVIRQYTLNEQGSDLANSYAFESPMFRDDGHINMDPKNGSITIALVIPSDAGIYEVVLILIKCLILLLSLDFK